MVSGLSFRKITHTACNLSAVLVCLSVSLHTLLHVTVATEGPSLSRWSEQNRILDGVHGEMKGNDENRRVHGTQTVSIRTPGQRRFLRPKGWCKATLGHLEMPLFCKGLKNMTFSVKEPSKNSLASGSPSFFYILTTLTLCQKRKGGQGRVGDRPMKAWTGAAVYSPSLTAPQCYRTSNMKTISLGRSKV